MKKNSRNFFDKDIKSYRICGENGIKCGTIPVYAEVFTDAGEFHHLHTVAY